MKVKCTNWPQGKPFEEQQKSAHFCCKGLSLMISSIVIRHLFSFMPQEKKKFSLLICFKLDIFLPWEGLNTHYELGRVIIQSKILTQARKSFVCLRTTGLASCEYFHLILKGFIVYCITRTCIWAYKWEAFIILKQWWGGHGSWSKQRDETQEIWVLFLTGRQIYVTKQLHLFLF